jgi:hypothetical protein
MIDRYTWTISGEIRRPEPAADRPGRRRGWRWPSTGVVVGNRLFPLVTLRPDRAKDGE